MPHIDLADVIVILAASVAALFALRRLRLSPVLGYLVAGIIIGPFGLGFVADIETIRSFAEFGVVFLLFTIGLELPLERIKVLSPSLFGLGLAQILVTGAAIAGIAVACGVSLDAAIVIGAALALSSTVFVIQILLDRRQIATRFGRAAFTVLLMQDLAVAPILVMTLVLTNREGGLAASLGLAGLEAAVALVAIVVLGRFVLRPLFAVVAAEKSDEIFAAASLLVVLGVAAFTEYAGLSLAIGGLLAGMVLAETEYRHQVSAEIRPFRALLLGLFFMSIGMQTNLDLAYAQFPLVLGIAAGLIALKTLVLAPLVLLFRLPGLYALPLGLLLAQGGEFGFVVFSAAMLGGLIEEGLGQALIIAVALSMMATPFLAWASARLMHWTAVRSSARVEEIDEGEVRPIDHVVIAGYGRVGRTVARELSDKGISFIALDRDPMVVSTARAQGERVYFGDASRPEILERLHLPTARTVVVALSDSEAATRLVGILRGMLPDLPVLARATNDAHAAELVRAGASFVVPELVATGRRLAQHIVPPGRGS
ncbi:MAG: cation:proton antiporter [Defluviicoccus sp.]|nr:cation:proton antiporter [Defluviicoccus sp.]MDE0386698.1 cation:proton antiporter [Defluviicoccus sp.]